MKFIVHCETLKQLNRALDSKTNGIRFGVEFCEWKIPSLETLKQAYETVEEAGLAFTYITPLLSNEGMEKTRKHLDYLETFENIEVVIGDLGMFNLLSKYENLQFRLGRPRVYIPGRNPWDQITRMPNPSFFSKRKVEKIFYQTNLNYVRTLEFYSGLGINSADVDWISKSFLNYKQLITKGFDLAIHTFAVPVAVTMRCHTARFLGEDKPAHCSKPCLTNAFNIHQNELKKEFVLSGNVIFRLVGHSRKEVSEINKIGIDEIILPMGSISRLHSSGDLNNVINDLLDGA
jgi:collagenase-like PrtC family protease